MSIAEETGSAFEVFEIRDTGKEFQSSLDPFPCDPRAAHPAVEEALPS